MTELLNVAQRTALTVSLRTFEMDLRQAAAWLDAGPEEGILYRRTVSLSPAQRAAIQQRIVAALREIARLAEHFELARFEQDFGTTFTSQMSTDWSSLCDQNAGTLRRYGDVHPDLAAQLDPGIDALIEVAAQLATVSARGQAP